MYSTLEIQSKISNYSIHFIENLNVIKTLIDQPNTITFIDSNVSKLYPELYRESNIVVECTENVKTLDGTHSIFDNLIERKANIQTRLVVIGGGILQDLIGFCASTYCRGIQYDLVPTTLLSQADSCLGGKTSINVKGKKNILGTFYPPNNIYICTEFLKTLSTLDYCSGLGEVYKFHILENKIDQFNIDGDINDMIYKGLLFKGDILSRDEFDKGERKYLNFGHTFGHALETTSQNNLPHGIAVILGSMIAIRIANKLKYEVPNYNLLLLKGIELIHQSNIKLEQSWFDLDSLLEIVKSDKKSTGKLTMVLSTNHNFLQDIEDIKIVKQSLQETYESI
jgi:3-dehydroquinate synthase